MLGTSTTTVRAMAERGELVYRAIPGPRRAKWKISRDSAQSWLEAHGRVDDRRGAYRAEQVPEGDLRQLLVSVTQQHRQVEAERDRLSDEVATLRVVAMQLRIRNEAVREAEEHHARATQLALDLAQAQTQAADALRRGMAAQDEAIGQFLVPGPPT